MSIADAPHLSVTNTDRLPGDADFSLKNDIDNCADGCLSSVRLMINFDGLSFF